MSRYNYLAFAMRLVREDRAKEFSEKEKQIPRDGNYRETFDKLCEEFGITEIMPEQERTCFCGRTPQFPHGIEIFKGFPA